VVVAKPIGGPFLAKPAFISWRIGRDSVKSGS
jgi:hypothetical protein